MRQRIHSIDAIRGFCLLNIFVNHVTAGSLQNISPSRIGFSDSAEAFVFLAGISSFLAYGPREGVAFFPTRVARMRARARAIFVHYISLAVAVTGIGLLGAMLGPPDANSMATTELIDQHGSWTYLWHVLTMQHPPGLAAILRLYVVLLLVAPAYVWLASKRFWLPLLPAGVVWVLAGHFGWVDHQSLSGDRLVLTILPWNMVFAAGISFGAAIVQRVELPVRIPLILLSLAVVLAGPACIVAAQHMPEIVTWIATKDDHFWTGVSKPLQSPLRLAHIFALAYLVVAFRRAPLIRLIHDVSPANPLCRLGRRSLQVFVCGAVLALLADMSLKAIHASGIVAERSAGSLALELAIFAFAFAAMLKVADYGRGRDTAAPAAKDAPLAQPL